jgi:hypothetical protein
MIDSVTFNADDKRNKSGQTLTKKELKKLQREKEKGAFDRLNPAPPIPKLEK